MGAFFVSWNNIKVITAEGAASWRNRSNPELQTEKFDPVLKYVKHWVPELGTATYPKPIVDHKFARDRVLKVYKDALGAKV